MDARPLIPIVKKTVFPLWLRWHPQVARGYRTLVGGVCFVGITGSVGKTTTKRLAAEVLGAPRTRLYSQIADTALTVMRVRPWHRFCVEELSGHKPGNLLALSRFYKPKIGVVTAVGNDHYDNFRSLEATAQEKGTLVEVLPPDGTAILNRDDPHVWGMRDRARAPVLSYGEAEDADLRCLRATCRWPERLAMTVRYRDEEIEVRTRMVGRHWRHVVLAALAIGVACGVPLATAARRLESVEPTLGRMCPHDAGEGVTVIDDGWKNPVHGLPAIFDFLREAEAGRKILVIGHISDYAGASTPKYIRAMKAALEAADLVISVGPSNESIRKRMDQLDAERLLVLDSLKEVNAYLKETLRPGDLVMLKGSHSADHLERLLLDRTLGVACWQSKCGLRTYCGVCVSRTKPSEPDAA